MKRMLSFFVVLVMSTTMWAANTRIYCKMDKAWWTQADAAVGCYYWGTGTSPKWPGVRMSKVIGEDNLWYIDLDTSTFPNVIFTRVNGSGDIADWGAKTGDLTVPTDGKDMFTITTSTDCWADGCKCDGSWSKYAPVSKDLKVKIKTAVGNYVEQSVRYTIECTATKTATMKIYVDSVEQKSQMGMSMSATITFADLGEHTVKLVGTTSTEKDSVIVKTTAIPATVVEKRPEGLTMGPHVDNVNRKVTLCTYAAGCKYPNDISVLEHARAVYLVGTFGTSSKYWTLREDMRLKRDGNYFWIELSGLTFPAKDTDYKSYKYQYAVVRADGKMVKISDLYSTIVNNNDSKADGYYSVFQTGLKPGYQWSEATLNFNRPDKNNLIIYEVWPYDNNIQHNLKGLIDKMDYFAQLGVNCIELMPVTEFDGEQSWGYNPNHYFAVENQYITYRQGSKSVTDRDLLKVFVDSCHNRGIAVVLDMVFNHCTGNNPMNKLYPFGDELQYNPWFNTSAPHTGGVYEDWNHDFGPTRTMVNDALAFWMDEYKVDGYRLDLSHGLCGKEYNAVENLKRYYNTSVKPRNGYMMLEHWGADGDVGQLVNEGMMCWVNTSESFGQTASGWLSEDDLYNANVDNYVSYSENHDEERVFAAAKMWGNGNLMTSEQARAARVPLIIGFQCMLDGPQLFYHYAEQGCELAKFKDASGKIGWDDKNKCCAYGTSDCDSIEYKMLPKNPYKYTWTTDTASRMQAMREVGKIIRLRTRYLPKVFEGNPTDGAIGSGYERRFSRWGNDVIAVGNFSASNNVTYDLPTGVNWYDYLNGATKANSSYTLTPGQIKIFTGKPIYSSIENVCENMAKNANVQKVILDGKMYIIRGEKMYDATGNLVQ